MNRNALLTITSLLSVLLFLFHLADDVVHGIEPGGLNNLFGGTAIMVVWLVGSLVLRERLAGYVILLLGGLLSFGVAYIHMDQNGVGEIGRASGGLFFVSTLLALGVTGIFGALLSIVGLWSLRRRADRVEP